MEDATTETEFASRLASLHDIAAVLYDSGLSYVLDQAQQLRLKVVIEKFEQANFSKERLYIILEQAELSVEEFAYLLHAYSSSWKRQELGTLANKFDDYQNFKSSAKWN